MRNSLLILVVTALFLSCSKKESSPAFKAVYDVDLGNLLKKTSKFRALVAFSNPSEDATFTVTSMEADIIVDGVDVGTFISNTSMKVLPKSDFTIPIRYELNPTKWVGENQEPAESYKVEINGTLFMLSSDGEKIKIPFSHTETVKVVIPKSERHEQKLNKREERKAAKEAKKLMKYKDGEKDFKDL
jgi:LEA14-like dessication related protein